AEGRLRLLRPGGQAVPVRPTEHRSDLRGGAGRVYGGPQPAFRRRERLALRRQRPLRPRFDRPGHLGRAEQYGRGRLAGRFLMRWGSLIAALTILTVVAAGCDRAPPPPRRGAISGKITLDGKPVAKANVRFIALEASGFNVLAPVKDGVYEVPEGQGLVKGKY